MNKIKFIGLEWIEMKQNELNSIQFIVVDWTEMNAIEGN
jgi:hypothetical protein